MYIHVAQGQDQDQDKEKSRSRLVLNPTLQGCNESLKFWVESSHLVSF